ncbi:MAG: hypothetical protein V4719_07220 [Planctomycetota bacterium]
MPEEDVPLVSDARWRSALTDWGMWLRRALLACLVTLQQGLPLFRREMLMQSSRVRTYIIRSAFATVLFFLALCYATIVTGTPILSAAIRLPGQGHVILDALVWILFAFIYVFGPATASGVITLEREQQTLVSLYLTKLTPWHIVLEKYLSRLLPLLGTLLLAMPLLVFAYSFGGVNFEMLITAMWFLAVTAIQVTAVAVLCSTVCQRTTQAFIVSYGVLLLIYCGPVLIDIWHSDGSLIRFFDSAGPSTWRDPTATTNLSNSYNNPLPAIPPEYVSFACFPAVLFTAHYEPSIVGPQFSLRAMLLAGVPSIISGMACLVLARLLLFYRAFEPQRFVLFVRLRHIVKKLWKGHRSHPAVGVPAQVALTNVPLDEPITWRDATRVSRNWLLILLVLEVLVLVLALCLAQFGRDGAELISLEICGLWGVSALLISVNSASLVTRERNQQTLDLLLTTPLTSAEIVQQMFNGTRRLMVVAAIPLFSCILFQAWWRTVLPGSQLAVPNFGAGQFLWWEYLWMSTACLVIYFPLISWVGLWAGLSNKSATRAILEALGFVFGACCVPQLFLLLPLLVFIPSQLFGELQFALLIIAQTSPLAMILLVEFMDMSAISPTPLLLSILNAAFYGALLVCGRRYVLQRADVLLGRTVYY